MYSICRLYPPIVLSLTYNIKYSSQFHQISLPIPHTNCIYAYHARPVTLFTQNLVRKSWFIQNLLYIFLPPQYFLHFTPNILSQTSLHINSFSLISLFYFSSQFIFHHTSFPLTLTLPHLSLRFTPDFFSTVFVFLPCRQILSAMSCPWFCTITLQFFPVLFISFLLSQSLFLAFSVIFFVTPPPINILSSHSLPRTDPSQFTIFTKFYFTLDSFSLLHISARCLLYSFFFLLDILPPCVVTFAVSHRLSSFIRLIVLVPPLPRSYFSQ